jgi:hypothetical protein
LARARTHYIISERGPELRRPVVDPFLHGALEKVDHNFRARFERHSEINSRVLREKDGEFLSSNVAARP